jgi:DHA1 family bicyclomycin/chloramphenicol resistance-like MFS transporter
MSNVSEKSQNKAPIGMIEFIALMALMTSLVALSTDSMLPALSTIGDHLGAKTEYEAHLIVSIFFLGLAGGQLFFGPYADTRGRRETIVVGLLIFCIGSLICIFAENMTMMLIGRVVQAFGVSGPRIASTAIIRDQFAGEAMARVMSFIMMVFILVPMIAPLVGQIVLNFFTWEHIFTLFLVVAVASGIWYLIRQPETLPKSKRQPFSWRRFFASSKFIVTHKEVIGPTLAMGCVFGAFLSYLSSSQTIFQGFYDVGDSFSYIFAMLAFSIGLASFLNGKIVMRWGMKRVSNVALICAIVCALAFCGLLFLFNGLPPLPLAIAMLFIEFFFVGLLFGNLNAMAMHPLGDMAGLGAALIGSISSIAAVPIAMIVDSFIVDNLYPIGIGFFVFLSLAKIAIWLTQAPAKGSLD